jgi:membrane protein
MTESIGPAARKGLLAQARGLLGLLWATINKFFSDGCSSMAASLSFYTFFSLPALLSLLLSLVGQLTDPTQLREAIVAQVGGLIGKAGAEQVTTIIAHSRAGQGPASLGTILSVLALAFGATTSFAQLQSALNRIWAVKPDPRRNQIRVFLVKRIFSFGIVVTVAFLMLVSLIVSAVLAAVSDWWGTHFQGAEWLLHGLDLVVSLVVVTLLFAIIYKMLPRVRIAWGDVWAGAFVTAVLFAIGKILVGLYVAKAGVATSFGTAGSLAVLLIWFYYAAQIFLLGAEFTWAFAHRYGSRRDQAPPETAKEAMAASGGAHE